MQIVSSANKLLQTISASLIQSSFDSARIATPFPALNAIAPEGGFSCRAVHEVLSPTRRPSAILPVLIARYAAQNRWIVWCDFARNFYPPAAAAMGLSLDRMLLLQPANRQEEIWAATECLRCAGVGVCVLAPQRLSFVQARRLQLAAEQGGGMGLLLRSTNAIKQPYAAATRWVVQPATGERTVQRWKVQLIHGHGGRVGQSVLLEVCHETHHVRAISTVVHRPGETTAVPA